MVDRSYLPFKSAREYMDRGMAKWMGFFISEHTTALSHMGDFIDFSPQMSNEEIALLISQVYVNSLEVLVFTSYRQEPYLGIIKEIFDESIYLSGEEPLNIVFEDIIKIVLAEDLWRTWKKILFSLIIFLLTTKILRRLFTSFQMLISPWFFWPRTYFFTCLPQVTPTSSSIL